MARTIRTVYEFVSRAQTGGAEEIRADLLEAAEAVDEFGDEAEEAGRQSAAAEGGLGKLAQAAQVAKVALAGLALAGIGAVTVTIGQVAADTIAASDAMTMFQARTGLADDELQSYLETAQKIYALGLGDNIDEVASTMALVRQVTEAGGDELGYITEQALRFQTVFGTDVAQTIGTVDSVMDAWGVTAEEAFDLLAKGMQQTGDSDLPATLEDIAQRAKMMGFEYSEVLSMIDTAQDLGLRRGTDFIAMLDTFSMRLDDNSAAQGLYNLRLGQMFWQYKQGRVSAAELFTAIQSGLGKIENASQRTRIMEQIFGSRPTKAMEAAILGVDMMTEAFENADGTMERVAKTMDKSITQTWRRFTATLRISLMQGLGPFIQRGLNALIPLLDRAGQWMATVGVPALLALGSHLERLTLKLAGFASGVINALGGTDKIIGTLAGLFGDLVEYIASLDTGRLALLGGALLMMVGPSIIAGLSNVVGLMGSIIAKFYTSGLSAAPLLLALAVMAAYDSNFGGLRDRVDELGQALQDRDLEGIFRGIAGAMLAIPLGIADMFGDLVGIDVEGGLSAWPGVFENLKTILGLLAGAVVSAWLSLRMMASDFVNNIKTKIQSGIDDIGTFISELPGKVSTAAANFGTEVETWITDKFKDAVTKIGHYVTGTGFDTFGGKISKLATNLPDWVLGLWDSIKGAIVTPFSDAVSEVWGWLAGDREDSLKNRLAGLPGEIEGALSGIGQAIKTKLVDPALEFLAPLINAFEDILKAIKAVGEWLGVGGDEGGGSTPENPPHSETESSEFDDPLMRLGRRDKGGRGRARHPYLIGVGAQPELFVPDTAGTFYPRGQYSLGLAPAAGAGTVHNWSGATFNLYGVQDIEGLYRELKHLERRKNV